MTALQRNLQVSFATAQDFEREYSENLINGGVFIASEEVFQLREQVGIHLILDFCDRSVLLRGEVVHCVPVGMQRAGAKPGVAVQLLGSAAGLRSQLAPLVQASGAFQCPIQDLGNRESVRVLASVLARITGPDFRVTGQTRDLSRTGVLVDVFGEQVPTGQSVAIELRHPTSGDIMEVSGRVVRQVEHRGTVAAVAIHFDSPKSEPSKSRCGEFDRFIEAVQHVEHSRHLGGIRGTLREFAPAVLLSMFGSVSPKGTLTIRSDVGEEQGVIGFRNGELCYVHLGGASGMKALSRLLRFTEGTFRFHASLEDLDEMPIRIALDAAILEADRQNKQVDGVVSRVPPLDAKPHLCGEVADPGELSKLEAAVLDLVRAGCTVQRIVEVIPEPDPAIYGALEALVEQGAISVPSGD